MNLHAQRDGSTECLNESPPEKEGKSASARFTGGTSGASMKALPKRKGNCLLSCSLAPNLKCLNESPPEKEGKSCNLGITCGAA